MWEYVLISEDVVGSVWGTVGRHCVEKRVYSWTYSYIGESEHSSPVQNSLKRLCSCLNRLKSRSSLHFDLAEFEMLKSLVFLKFLGSVVIV